jgi:hypothetical protein
LRRGFPRRKRAEEQTNLNYKRPVDLSLPNADVLRLKSPGMGILLPCRFDPLMCASRLTRLTSVSRESTKGTLSDVSNSLLSSRLNFGGGLRRQLKHGGFLTLVEVS